MPAKTVQDWVRWIYDNDNVYTRNVKLTPSGIARMGIADALAICRDYIETMIELDGKRNLLYQEKQMIKQLGLGV